MISPVLVIWVTLSILRGCEADCQCLADDWTSVEGVGCFKYFESVKTFTDAEKACYRQSETPGKIIHLASVHSEDEFSVLRDMIPMEGIGRRSYVFIGLHMKGGLPSAWTDGSFYDYENWCPLALPEAIAPDTKAYGALTPGTDCLGSWFNIGTQSNFRLPYICKSPCL